MSVKRENETRKACDVKCIIGTCIICETEALKYDL